MRAGTLRAVAVLMAITMLSAGCLTGDDDEGDGDGKGLPHEGVTEGFRFPEVTLEVVGLGEVEVRTLEADLLVVHLVASASMEDIRVQDVHFGPLRDRFGNATVLLFTVVADPGAPWEELEALAGEDGIHLPSRPRGDIAGQLSVGEYPTVFILDERKVIILRSDGQMGQGRMIEAIEGHWGVPPPAGTGLEPGDLAPDLLWVDVDGNVGWLDNLRDHVVIINVWENECPFCLLLMEELAQVRANHTELVIVSIDHNPDDGEQVVRAVRERYNATWTFAIDSDNIQSRYDVWLEPVIYLVDGDGVIRWHNIGLVDSSVIAGEVEKLI